MTVQKAELIQNQSQKKFKVLYKQPKMSMSLDRLFFFWRKGDSLLIEKREQDLFERMKNCIGCTYISDLPRYRYEVWEKMKRISLDQYTLKQLDDFCEYVFGIRYWMVKQMQEREGTFEKSECK